MKKNSLLFFILIFFSFFTAASASGPADLQLIPLSRYSYYNVDGYGFYEKCSDYSWFGMVFNNTGEKTIEVTFPDEVFITGWNGTRHTISNLHYRDFDLSRNNFQNFDRSGTSFQKKISVPAHKVYAVFMDINNISNYNLYWDTNIFFPIEISDGDQCISRKISGIIAQRGNACPPDQVCSAQILGGSYASDGSGDVTVKVKNNMPDSAIVTAFSDVNISWVNSSGIKQDRTFSNAVTWTSQPGQLVSGAEKTISGRLSLPVEIASVSRELTVTFQLFHPTSLYFGYFNASSRIQRRAGLSGTMSGNFDTDGKNGSFTAKLFNEQNQTLSVPLPGTGSVKDAAGNTAAVTLQWKQSSPVTVPAQGSIDLAGTFRFNDTGLIHGNSSLILSAAFKAGNTNGSAAGVVYRNPDPDPTIRSAGFCRDLSSGNSRITFAYALTNPSRIDIPVDLAGTMAVSGHTRNLIITYTDCESSGISCFSRIRDNKIDLQAGETAVFIGTVEPEQALTDPDPAIRTSLVYYPDGNTKYLYVGETKSACAQNPAESVPSAAPAAGHETPAGEGPEERSEQNVGRAVFDQSIYNAVYSRCESDPGLNFTLAVSNNGTAPGTADLSKAVYKINGETAAARYTACAVMSPEGKDDLSCREGMGSGKIIILPGTTLQLSAEISPLSIDNEKISVRAEFAGDDPQVIEFAALSGGASCAPAVEIIPDEDGEEINSTVSLNKDSVTLTVQLANTGRSTAKIKAGSIYLHKAAVNSYQGICSIDPASSDSTEAELQQFSDGSVISLPSRSAATLTVTLPVDMADAYASTADVSWNFLIDNESGNFTGTINFARSIGKNLSAPVIPETNKLLHYYALAEPPLPENLPATGFPVRNAGGRHSVHPGHSEFQTLNGLHLEIPAIDAEAELVRISLNDKNEWAVEGLTEQAGILSSSALPGQGTSVIAAHNHLDEATPGPFLWLFELENNDRLFVIDEEGQILKFSVYANELFSPTDSERIYLKAIPGSLVLLTCETEMPDGGYAYRRAVFAEPLQ